MKTQVIDVQNIRTVALNEIFDDYKVREYSKTLSFLKQSLSIVNEAIGLNHYNAQDLMFLGGSLSGEPEIWMTFKDHVNLETKDFKNMAKMGIEANIFWVCGTPNLHLKLNKRPLFDENPDLGRIGSIPDEIIAKIENLAKYHQPRNGFRFYYENNSWKTYMYVNQDMDSERVLVKEVENR